MNTRSFLQVFKSYVYKESAHGVHFSKGSSMNLQSYLQGYLSKVASKTSDGTIDRLTDPSNSYPGSSTTRSKDLDEFYSDKMNDTKDKDPRPKMRKVIKK